MPRRAKPKAEDYSEANHKLADLIQWTNGYKLDIFADQLQRARDVLNWSLTRQNEVDRNPDSGNAGEEET